MDKRYQRIGKVPASGQPMLEIDEVDRQIFSTAFLGVARAQDEIFAQLSEKGFGDVVAFSRNQIFSMAETQSAIDEIKRYWTEYASERLTAFGGPVDILRGQHPIFQGYRSSYLEALRKDRAPVLNSPGGNTRLPYIQPTIIRFFEQPRLLQDEFYYAMQRFHRSTAEEFYPLVDLKQPEYTVGDPLELYAYYDEILIPNGFTKGRLNSDGCVYRQPCGLAGWDFVVVDESRRNLWMTMLTVSFGVARSGQKIVSGHSYEHCVVSFVPDDLIPGFRNVQHFKAASAAQLRYAVHSIAVLALLIKEFLGRELNALAEHDC